MMENLYSSILQIGWEVLLVSRYIVLPIGVVVAGVNLFSTLHDLWLDSRPPELPRFQKDIKN